MPRFRTLVAELTKELKSIRHAAPPTTATGDDPDPVVEAFHEDALDL